MGAGPGFQSWRSSEMLRSVVTPERPAGRWMEIFTTGPPPDLAARFQDGDVAIAGPGSVAGRIPRIGSKGVFQGVAEAVAIDVGTESADGGIGEFGGGEIRPEEAGEAVD